MVRARRLPLAAGLLLAAALLPACLTGDRRAAPSGTGQATTLTAWLEAARAEVQAALGAEFRVKRIVSWSPTRPWEPGGEDVQLVAEVVPRADGDVAPEVVQTWRRDARGWWRVATAGEAR